MEDRNGSSTITKVWEALTRDGKIADFSLYYEPKQELKLFVV